jgi:hypothetical protein
MVIETSQLMMYTAKVAVCSEIRTKHSTPREHHVEFLNVKNLVVREDTATVLKVNRLNFHLWGSIEGVSLRREKSRMLVICGSASSPLVRLLT